MAKKHSGDKAEKADADRVQYEAWLKKRLPDSAKEKSKAEEFVAQIMDSTPAFGGELSTWVFRVCVVVSFRS